MGSGRMGVRVASVMTLVQTGLRVPVRRIRMVLLLLSPCEISTGEVVDLRPRVGSHAEPVLATITGQIRASPAVHAKETR